MRQSSSPANAGPAVSREDELRSHRARSGLERLLKRRICSDGLDCCRTLRPGCGFTASFAFIDVHFLLRQPPNCPQFRSVSPRTAAPLEWGLFPG